MRRGHAAVFSRAEDKLRGEGVVGAEAFHRIIDACYRSLQGEEDELLKGVAVCSDLLGWAWQKTFPGVFRARSGQYFTPLPISRLLLSHLPALQNKRVLDPMAGSATLLVLAAERGATVLGWELDSKLCRLANLTLNSQGFASTVEHRDAFESEAQVEVVVANPAFSVEVKGTTSERLFCEHLHQWVVEGGWAALILPWSFVANDSWEPDRKRLEENWSIERIVALPEGVFRPLTGAGGLAAAVWLRRGPSARGPLFRVLKNPGYKVNSRRFVPVSEEELEQVIAGEGFVRLQKGCWIETSQWHTTLASVLQERQERRRASQRPEEEHSVVSLADADKRCGDLRERVLLGAQIRGTRPVARPLDLLVSRLRPELGNVCINLTGQTLVGSPEWLVFHTMNPGYWLLVLRSQSFPWPYPTGQTRPRIATSDLLAVPVTLTSRAKQIDLQVKELLLKRREIDRRLAVLQHEVDLIVKGSEPKEDGMEYDEGSSSLGD